MGCCALPSHAELQVAEACGRLLRQIPSTHLLEREVRADVGWKHMQSLPHNVLTSLAVDRRAAVASLSVVAPADRLVQTLLVQLHLLLKLQCCYICAFLVLRVRQCAARQSAGSLIDACHTALTACHVCDRCGSTCMGSSAWRMRSRSRRRSMRRP